jgi:hypothetical protein
MNQRKESWRQQQIGKLVRTAGNHFAQCNSWSGGVPWSYLRKLPLEQIRKYHCVGRGRCYGYEIEIYSLDKSLRPKHVGRAEQQRLQALEILDKMEVS